MEVVCIRRLKKVELTDSKVSKLLTWKVDGYKVNSKRDLVHELADVESRVLQRSRS